MFAVVIGDNEDGLADFCTLIQAKADYFSITFDEASPRGCTMLDVQLTAIHGHYATYVAVEPFIKPTAHGMFLEASSAHASSVHESWPIGRIRHFPNISSSDSIANRYCRYFYDKLRQQNPTHPALHTIELELDGRRYPRIRRIKHSGSWLVLPFHPQWKTEVEAAVKECYRICSSHNLPDVAPRVSWSLCGPNLFKRFRV